MTVASNSYGYDSNGNLTYDGGVSYTYDAENRLVATSSGASLVYDPLGRLYETYSLTTGTKRFLYDGDALVAEYDGVGTMLRRYVHGDRDDDPQIWFEGSGVSSPRYLYADHQGSIVAVTDAAGTMLGINSYDEYGVPGGAKLGRFQYTGQAWIPEIGMYYYKARIYSPMLGRFLQTDPIGYKDQVNLYAYVANDPVNGIDPTGMYECEGTETQCANADRFVEGVKKAAAGDGASDSLRSVAAALGDPNTAGVTIRFASLRGALGDQKGNVVRLDLNAIADSSRSMGTHQGVNAYYLVGTSVVAHEGDHYVNRSAYDTSTVRGRMDSEKSAYRVSGETLQRYGVYGYSVVNRDGQVAPGLVRRAATGSCAFSLSGGAPEGSRRYNQAYAQCTNNQ